VEEEDVTFNAIFDAQAGISVEKSTFRTWLDSFHYMKESKFSGGSGTYIDEEQVV
jgi:hypothetical protein